MRRKSPQPAEPNPELPPAASLLWGFTGASGGLKRQKNRSLGTSAGTVILTHAPTGLTLKTDIPEGHYSKKEFRLLKLKAQERLLTAMAQEIRKR